MEEVPVPKENMLENVTGLKGPFSCLKYAICVQQWHTSPRKVTDTVRPFLINSNARFGISFGVIGALEDCIARAREYALDRTQFGVPLASFQLV